MRKYFAALAVAALALGTAGVAWAQDPPVTSIDNSNQNNQTDSNNTTESNNDNRCRDASIILDAIQTVTQSVSQSQTGQTQTVNPPVESTVPGSVTQGDNPQDQANSQDVAFAIDLLIDCSVNTTTNNFPPAQTITVTLPSGQIVVVPLVVSDPSGAGGSGVPKSATASAVVGVPRFTG